MLLVSNENEVPHLTTPITFEILFSHMNKITCMDTLINHFDGL